MTSPRPDQPGDVRGQHICLLYDSEAEQRSVALPFLKRGLEAGDCCIYIADERTPGVVVDDLRAAGVDIDQLAQHGAVQVLTKYETFLRYARFEPRLMFEFLEKTARNAARNGFQGVRITAEMSWALGTGCQHLVEFEALCNDHLAGWHVTMLCQYNLQRFAPGILLDVLRAHPSVHSEHRTCENVYFEPKEMVLDKGSDIRRVRWMLDTVKRLDRRRVNGMSRTT